LAKAKQPGAFERYYRSSRSLAASYVFIAPFFAVYQAALAFDDGVRSGTAPLLRELFERLSQLGLLTLNLVLLATLFFAIWRTRAARRRVAGLYALMFLESLLVAAFMMATAQFVVGRHLLALSPLARQLFANAGAGIYEEVLFRYLLLGGLVLVLHRGLGGHKGWVVPLAILVSAALFSWAHHALGGQPYDRSVFLYRTLMGVILGTVFWFRGLGIVVYAHALYNVSLVLIQLQYGGGA
jgi:Type II CAAX prenyl endopeptidase Rce1-like